MGRGRFVLFYNGPGDPKPAEPSTEESDSLIALMSTACRANFGGDEGGRALRIEQGGRTILDEATLLGIAGRVRALEEVALAESPSLTQVNLRGLAYGVMLEMGLIDERGEPVATEDAGHPVSPRDTVGSPARADDRQTKAVAKPETDYAAAPNVAPGKKKGGKK